MARALERPTRRTKPGGKSIAVFQHEQCSSRHENWRTSDYNAPRKEVVTPFHASIGLWTAAVHSRTDSAEGEVSAYVPKRWQRGGEVAIRPDFLEDDRRQHAPSPRSRLARRALGFRPDFMEDDRWHHVPSLILHNLNHHDGLRRRGVYHVPFRVAMPVRIEGNGDLEPHSLPDEMLCVGTSRSRPVRGKLCHRSTATAPLAVPRYHACACPHAGTPLIYGVSTIEASLPPAGYVP